MDSGAITLSPDEKALCDCITDRASAVLKPANPAYQAESLDAIEGVFDEQIVANYLEKKHNLRLRMSDVLRALRDLASQTYENKPLSFGCLIEPRNTTGDAVFPGELLESKKYKALSDGFRTAYVIDQAGRLLGFRDLLDSPPPPMGGIHFYPEWCDHLANWSRDEACGVCLTKHGDILVLSGGSLHLSYRFGKWQFWNHNHLSKLIRNLARYRGRANVESVGRVANSVYRGALDVAFRRTGGLFVILHNVRSRAELVVSSEQVGDESRRPVDAQFDQALGSMTIDQLPRHVLSEIAGLDGAVVVDRKGTILAYGAVLQTGRRATPKGTEGSRTKAAIVASHFGTAVKVSSDGDITVFAEGKKFLSVG